MKSTLLIFLVIAIFGCKPKEEEIVKNWTIEELSDIPESVTNNAVVEGFINDEPYIFSFAGLDSTKKYSGIHLRSYRYDIVNNVWQQIADLPDTLGKIASAASRVKDTIYVIGGYHVFSDGSERSSNKVHRYDIKSNRFLTNGAAIPIPIDDQVQAVWRDSLIYIVSGWSDKENVPNVQVYNPFFNKWNEATSIPNNHTYKSFGASGVIIADTIYYFGGASMGKHYPIQNVLRKGIINPKNPSYIEWSHAVLDTTIVGYRMAASSVKNIPYWIGGSTVTYNYNPIAYNGSGKVNPANRALFFKEGELQTDFSNKFPMDLRGIAEINDSTKVIIGGIKENQQVSNKVYLLKWIND